MTIVEPSLARVITSAWASRVPSPLHDALDPVTRATVLATNPDSWLHVARRADDQAWLDPNEVTARSAAALDHLMTSDAYTPAASPHYFLYRYEDASHAQMGLVAAIPINAFLDGGVLGHEHVEPHRVRALVAHQRHLSMRGDLVAVLMPDDAELATLFQEISSDKPEVTIPGELHHAIWRVPEEYNQTLSAAIAPLQLFLIDGHHRVAAAVEEWRALGEPDGFTVLSIITAQSQLRALAFDRRVVGPLNAKELVVDIEPRMSIRSVDQPVRTAGHVMLYWNETWFDICFPKGSGDGVNSLDVIRLHHELIEPLFGIREWADPRLEVTSERVDVDVLRYRCDNDGGAAFILHAPSVEAIVEVAKRGEQMPPKSTYFDPKPWSGVFLAAPLQK